MAKQPIQLKRNILFPIWILRTCLGLFFLIAFGLAIRLSDRKSLRGASGILAFVIILYLVEVGVILLDILQFIMFMRGSLRASAFLFMNSVQTFFWGAILLTDIALLAKAHDASVGVTGLGFLVPMFFLCLALLVHAAMAFHHDRQVAKQIPHETA